MSDNKREKMIEIYRSTFTALAAMRLENLTVNIDVNLGGEVWFHITVFDELKGNVTFNFYEFQKIEDVEKYAEIAIKVIKTDDFINVKSKIA